MSLPGVKKSFPDDDFWDRNALYCLLVPIKRSFEEPLLTVRVLGDSTARAPRCFHKTKVSLNCTWIVFAPRGRDIVMLIAMQSYRGNQIVGQKVS